MLGTFSSSSKQAASEVQTGSLLSQKLVEAKETLNVFYRAVHVTMQSTYGISSLCPTGCCTLAALPYMLSTHCRSAVPLGHPHLQTCPWFETIPAHHTWLGAPRVTEWPLADCFQSKGLYSEDTNFWAL